jgi:hypothetical protein
VYPTEIVIREVQSASGLEIVQLFAESVGQPRKATGTACYRNSEQRNFRTLANAKDLRRAGLLVITGVAVEELFLVAYSAKSGDQKCLEIREDRL